MVKHIIDDIHIIIGQPYFRSGKYGLVVANSSGSDLINGGRILCYPYHRKRRLCPCIIGVNQFKVNIRPSLKLFSDSRAHCEFARFLRVASRHQHTQVGRSTSHSDISTGGSVAIGYQEILTGMRNSDGLTFALQGLHIGGNVFIARHLTTEGTKTALRTALNWLFRIEGVVVAGLCESLL